MSLTWIPVFTGMTEQGMTDSRADLATLWEKDGFDDLTEY